MRTADQTVESFCMQLAAGTPAPGGGAAAAVSGAMGAALVAMVAGVTLKRDKFAAVHDEMTALQQVGRRELAELLACADEDQAAFEQVMAAFALPKGTTAERAERQRAVQSGYRRATLSPLKTMEHSLLVLQAALAVARSGNPNALSDAHVGYLAAGAAFDGALWNVAINLGSLSDERFKHEVLAKVQHLRKDRSEIAVAFCDLTPDPIALFSQA